MHVFISYSRMDMSYAQLTRSCAGKLNWQTFLDEEDLPPGGEWRLKIRSALESSELFLGVLTPRWIESTWARLELDVYCELIKLNGQKKKEIIFLEFEKVSLYDHMIPIIAEKQKIANAAGLKIEELCWLMHCGHIQKSPGTREAWAGYGSNIISSRESVNEGTAGIRLSPVERMQLEDELFYRIKSMPVINEIAHEIFGSNNQELPKDARSAWYYIVERSNRENTLNKLIKLTKAQN